MDQTAWTAVAAVIASIAAGIVAWQSWETRRSANAAVEALKLARKEQGISRFLANEAVRTRLDSRAPQVTLSLTLQWPPEVDDPGRIHPYRPGEPFRTPRDGSLMVSVAVYAQFRNEGSTAVKIQYGTTLSADGSEKIGAIILPGQTAGGKFAVTRTVEEWIAAYRAHHSGESVEDHWFEARYIDPADTGIIETYRGVVSGSVLHPVADEEGAWRIVDEPTSASEGVIVAVEQPTIRRYYLSRENDVLLPAIGPDDA